MKSTLWVGGIEEHVFPNAPFTQKHIHLHFALWSRMHHLFCFFYSSEDAKAFESQTDFSRICTFLCISFLHYKMELHIIIPCYCMKQLSITTMFNIFKSDKFCFTKKVCHYKKKFYWFID